MASKLPVIKANTTQENIDKMKVIAEKNKRSMAKELELIVEKHIKEYEKEHGEITPKEAEAVTGKSAATVRRYFKILTGTRYIVAEGSTNNMVYHIAANLPEDD